MIDLKEVIEKITHKLFGTDDFEDVMGYLVLGIIAVVLILLVLLIVAVVVIFLGFWTPIVLIALYLFYLLGKRIDDV